MSRTRISTKKTTGTKEAQTPTKASGVSHTPISPPSRVTPPTPAPEAVQKAPAPSAPAVKKAGPQMMRFRLMQGCHYTNPAGHKRPQIRHTPGDIIESYQDLTIIFLNKFKRVLDDIEIPEAVIEQAHKAAKRAVKEMIPAIVSAQAGTTEVPSVRVVARGGGRYDVVREDTGQPINDRNLTLDEAKSLETQATAGLREKMKEPQQMPAPQEESAVLKDEVEEM